MPQRQPILEARASHGADVRQRERRVPGSGVLAQLPIGPSVGQLRQKARDELDALEASLASQLGEGSAIRAELTALSRTVARIGARAGRLEREAVRMHHCAYHDPLTGLPSRTLLLDRLDRALAQAARRDGQVALLMFDVDGFKAVNDQFGHVVGDRLLQGIADRLLRSTRDADTTCRYGGDEFVVLLPEADGRQGATAVAQKIQASLARPFLVDGHSIAVSACIGIAVYPLDGIAPVHLLQRADVAMYGAKDDLARRHLSQDWEGPSRGLAGRHARRVVADVSGSAAPGTEAPRRESVQRRFKCLQCGHFREDRAAAGAFSS